MKNKFLKLFYKLFFQKRSFLVILFLFFLFPWITLAADLFISSSSQNISAGSEFTIFVKVNTSSKYINNAEGIVSYPKNLVEFVSISKSSSIFDLWINEPSNSSSSGTISFNGGVRSPGFSGSSGTIFSAKFKAKSSGIAVFSFSSAFARENDGLGTDILTSARQLSLTFSPAKKVIPASTPVSVPTPITPVIEPTLEEKIAPVLVSVPVFTDYSKDLKEGEFLVVKGLADSFADIIITSDNIILSTDGVVRETTTIKANDKGMFAYVSERVAGGIYIITAQARNKDGILSEKTSSPIKITASSLIVPSTSVSTKIMNVFFIIILMISPVILLILFIIWIWHRIIEYKRKKIVDMSESTIPQKPNE